MIDMSFPHDPDFVNSTLLNGQPGASVKIHAGFSKSRGKEVVYKALEVNPTTEFLLPFARQEGALAIENRSDHICEVFECKEVWGTDGNHYFCIIMERLESDWFKEIEDHLLQASHYTEKLLWDRLYPLVATLAALQERKIAHRDIKPQNIFLKGKSSQVKLGDFGSSKIIDEYYGMQTLQGTPFYLSPLATQAMQRGDKLLKHDLFKSDVYSLGMTFMHACYLELKVEWLRDTSGRKIVLNFPEFPYSKNLEDVLKCMVQANEEERPDFRTLAGWLGVYPDLIQVRYVAGVKCSQCASDSPNAGQWSLPCGHQLVFCSNACIENYLQQDRTEDRVMCRQCGVDSGNTELKAWCTATIQSGQFTISADAKSISSEIQPTPEEITPAEETADLIEPVSEKVSQESGVCDQCHRHEIVFQICHPLCFECALTSASISPACQACRTRLPTGLLEILGLKTTP